MALTVEIQIKDFIERTVIPMLKKTAEHKPDGSDRVFSRYPLTLVKVYQDPEDGSLSYYGLCVPEDERGSLDSPCGQYPTIAEDGRDISEEAFDRFIADMRDVSSITHVTSGGDILEAPAVAVIYFSPVESFDGEDLQNLADSRLFQRYVVGYYTKDMRASMRHLIVDVQPLDQEEDADMIGHIYKRMMDTYLEDGRCDLGGCSPEDVRAARRLYRKVIWPKERPQNLAYLDDVGLWEEDTNEENPFVKKES